MHIMRITFIQIILLWVCLLGAPDGFAQGAPTALHQYQATSTSTYQPFTPTSQQDGTGATRVIMPGSTYTVGAWRGELTAIGADSPLGSANTGGTPIHRAPTTPHPADPVDFPLGDMPCGLLLLLGAGYVLAKRRKVGEK